jgi:hypothetical protein
LQQFGVESRLRLRLSFRRGCISASASSEVAVEFVRTRWSHACVRIDRPVGTLGRSELLIFRALPGSLSCLLAGGQAIKYASAGQSSLAEPVRHLNGQIGVVCVGPAIVRYHRYRLALLVLRGQCRLRRKAARDCCSLWRVPQPPTQVCTNLSSNLGPAVISLATYVGRLNARPN